MQIANDQIESVNISIDQAKKQIAIMESILKLTKNRDWKRVIDEGYFEKEAARLVILKADPSLQSDEHQNQLNKSIDAIGYFRQYLMTQIQLGRMAEKSLKEDEAVRDELLAEELDD